MLTQFCTTRLTRKLKMKYPNDLVLNLNPPHPKSWQKIITVMSISILTACADNSVPNDPTADLKAATSGIAATNAEVVKVAEPASNNKVGNFHVSEILNIVEGKKDYVLSSINCNSTGVLYNQKGIIKSNDPAIQVVQGSLDFGGSSFNQCQLSSGKAVVRIDNGKEFDASKLSLTMSADKQAEDNPIKLIKIDFYRKGGRAGHGGNLALNSQYPVQGETTELKVNISGVDLKVEYLILDINNQSIKKGLLEKNQGSENLYQVVFEIPLQPFSVLINAVDKNGNTFKSRTELYKPHDAKLDLTINNAVIRKANQKIVAEISGKAATTGKLLMMVHVPNGFSTEISSKSLDVVAGQDISLPFTITSPLDPVIGKIPIYFQYKFNDRDEVLVLKKLLAIDAGE